jgi:hypothetical protein
MASIFEILSKPLNVQIKFRGFWNPASGFLPSTTVYPLGSILIANSTGTISGTDYPVNSLLLNANNAWNLVGTSTENIIENPAPIEYLLAEENDNLNIFDGLDSEDEFIYQIVSVTGSIVSSITNLPIQQQGILEVFGSLGVQRYTTETGRIFTRLFNDVSWNEITTDISELEETLQILLDEQYNLYSVSGIETEGAGGIA